MSNGPIARARRSKKFLAKMSKRENPIRFACALPSDIKLDDISWMPDHFEQIATRLAEMRQRWAREDNERRQQRLKEVMAAVEADRKAGYLD